MYRQIRGFFRDLFFYSLHKALINDDGKRAAAESLKGLLAQTPQSVKQIEWSLPPYSELGAKQKEEPTGLRDDIVFITGRFRSGSTLLWNLFRQIDQCTAYYEPFNERRWFDTQVRGERVDGTHIGVSDYWREYNGLERLAEYYREDWIRRNLFMDENFWDPGMKRYVETLVESSSGRPVLQFNRIDFRLPWIRRQFPRSRIVHIYRHPRNQWCSTLGKSSRFGPEGSVQDFQESDKFYLLMWSRDLKYHFPFLAEEAVQHPYEIFYYMWRLSYFFGIRYADYSIQFEQLVREPDPILRELLKVVGIKKYNLNSLKEQIFQPSLNKWRDYASDEWFKEHESRCENVLAEFLGT